MTKAEDSKQYDLEAGLLVFEFRYCLGFSTPDLGFNPCLDYAPLFKTLLS